MRKNAGASHETLRTYVRVFFVAKKGHEVAEHGALLLWAALDIDR
jgi:hypothetical protein